MLYLLTISQTGTQFCQRLTGHLFLKTEGTLNGLLAKHSQR